VRPALWTVCLGLLFSAACGPAQRPAPPAKIKLAVLPAESDKFPKTAKVVTDSLTAAQVAGIDEREVSAVSIEVVQLSIECVEETVGCYEAVGKQLAANRILFAQIAPESKNKKKLRVSVTLFDVDARSPKTAERVYANEKEASAGIADLVAEATR
jgi:hypothetical protein